MGAGAVTLCCSFDCTERGLEPREAFQSMPDDRFGPERSHFYVLGFFFNFLLREDGAEGQGVGAGARRVFLLKE